MNEKVLKQVKIVLTLKVFRITVDKSLYKYNKNHLDLAVTVL